MSKKILDWSKSLHFIHDSTLEFQTGESLPQPLNQTFFQMITYNSQEEKRDDFETICSGFI